MQGCFTWLLLVAGGIFLMLTLIRWFEQTADVVDRRQWNRAMLLVAFPFAAWFYSAKVVAGRPTPVPAHEPVRGMGALPKVKPKARPPEAIAPPPASAAPAVPVRPAPVDDGPPPGTPKEFLGKPVIPPKPKGAKPAVDPDKLAKLRQKMREQGMLEGED
jgi:hypothetical protein